MTNLKTKIATAAATGAVLFQAVVPAFAGNYTFDISGNGSHADNRVDFDRDVETGIFQSNDSVIVNDISISSNTGDNDASDNTGGDVEIETGRSEISASVINQANTNHAEIEACDCDSDTDVKVVDNGTGTDNTVKLENKHQTDVVQDNEAEIVNELDFEANSGDNDADDNTGGSVKIDTGRVVISPVQIANLAGINSARIGSGSQSSDSELNLKVAGNGSDSDNDVEVENGRETGIFQYNGTGIYNDLYFGGYTGDNQAEGNTGDSYTDPEITTGNVTIKAYVDNAAGFNVAEADCGCVLDVMGSITGNGTDSDSDVDLKLDDELEVAQDNYDHLMNGGEIMSDTGDNETDDNTSGAVSVDTGNTTTMVQTANVGGTNAFGAVEFVLPMGMSFVLGL